MYQHMMEWSAIVHSAEPASRRKGLLLAVPLLTFNGNVPSESVSQYSDDGIEHGLERRLVESFPLFFFLCIALNALFAQATPKVTSAAKVDRGSISKVVSDPYRHCCICCLLLVFIDASDTTTATNQKAPR